MTVTASATSGPNLKEISSKKIEVNNWSKLPVVFCSWQDVCKTYLLVDYTNMGWWLFPEFSRQTGDGCEVSFFLVVTKRSLCVTVLTGLCITRLKLKLSFPKFASVKCWMEIFTLGSWFMIHHLSVGTDDFLLSIISSVGSSLCDMDRGWGVSRFLWTVFPSGLKMMNSASTSQMYQHWKVCVGLFLQTQETGSEMSFALQIGLTSFLSVLPYMYKDGTKTCLLAARLFRSFRLCTWCEAWIQYPVSGSVVAGSKSVRFDGFFFAFSLVHENLDIGLSLPTSKQSEKKIVTWFHMSPVFAVLFYFVFQRATPETTTRWMTSELSSKRCCAFNEDLAGCRFMYGKSGADIFIPRVVDWSRWAELTWLVVPATGAVRGLSINLDWTILPVQQRTDEKTPKRRVAQWHAAEVRWPRWRFWCGLSWTMNEASYLTVKHENLGFCVDSVSFALENPGSLSQKKWDFGQVDLTKILSFFFELQTHFGDKICFCWALCDSSVQLRCQKNTKCFGNFTLSAASCEWLWLVSVPCGQPLTFSVGQGVFVPERWPCGAFLSIRRSRLVVLHCVGVHIDWCERSPNFKLNYLRNGQIHLSDQFITAQRESVADPTVCWEGKLPN